MPHVRLGYLHGGQHRSCVLGFLDTVAGYDGRSVIPVLAFADDDESVVVAVRFLAHPADYRIHVLIPASPVVGEDGPIPCLGQDASVLVDLTLYDMQQFCKEWVRRSGRCLLWMPRSFLMFMLLPTFSLCR